MEDNFIKIQKWLYPASFLYGMGVWVRNKLFDWEILQSKSFAIPIIAVGNITVGGTGKTPHTEYLIELLQNEFSVAMLSRGYKRETDGFEMADANSSAKTIGDEPYQIKQKFPEVCIAVDKDRRHGIELLTQKGVNRNLQVIILDDAFQHRYVQAGINILLIDFYRMIFDDALLPAGRLREPAKGKNRAQIVIITKCPPNITPMDFRILSKRLNLYPYQQLYFSSFVYGELTPVFCQSNGTRPLSSLGETEEIILLSGIASPKQLMQDLEEYTSRIHPMTFEDHHSFSRTDMQNLKEKFEQLPEGLRIIITTEKDAARLTQHPSLDDSIKPYIYALPIKVEFLQNQQDTFNQNIIGYVRKNKRNSILSERKNAHRP